LLHIVAPLASLANKLVPLLTIVSRGIFNNRNKSLASIRLARPLLNAFVETFNNTLPVVEQYIIGF